MFVSRSGRRPREFTEEELQRCFREIASVIRENLGEAGG
jgi:hypothetical protein